MTKEYIYIYIEKAYDRVNRGMMCRVLEEM